MENRTVVLNSWQSRVWKDESRYVVLACGRRAGKSFYSALRIAAFVQKHPNSIVYYLATTYQQSKSIMWEMLRNTIPSFWIKKTNESELKIELVNNSKIELKGADTEPDRLRGVRIDFLICDEVAYFKNWKTVWNNVLRPTLIDSKGKAIFISNPNGYNHFYDLYLMGVEGSGVKNSDYSSYRFTTYDNEYIDRVEIDKMRAEMDEDTFAQEIMAEFKKYTGLVFKYFSREKHYVPPLEFPPDTTFYRGVDFGWSSPSAVVFLAVTPEGKAYVYDLIYQAGLTTPDLAALIKQKSAGRHFAGSFADSAQASDINELLKYGIMFTPVSKSVAKKGLEHVDFVTYKIRKTNELIKANKFFIFNHLSQALFEMENYQYKEITIDGEVKERPAKINDHFIDAVSYVVVNLPTYFEPSLVETPETRVEEPYWFTRIPSWSGVRKVIN